MQRLKEFQVFLNNYHYKNDNFPILWSLNEDEDKDQSKCSNDKLKHLFPFLCCLKLLVSLSPN